MIEASHNRRIVVLLLAALLYACGGIARVPEERFYRLDTDMPAASSAAPTVEGILSVHFVASAPLYRDRAMLYSEPSTPARLQRYHYHYWIDTPPLLLQRGFAGYLRAAGFASRVVTPEEGVDGAYRLRLVLERFEHQRGPNGGRVNVAWTLALSERASGRLLRQEQLQTTAGVRGDEFSAVAAAYAQAVTELYARSLDLLSRGL